MKRLNVWAAVVALGIAGVGVNSASAGPRGDGHGSFVGHGYGGSYGHGASYGGPTARVYHAPSVHGDYVPHRQLHTSPRLGLYRGRHFDSVPHYTPGHFFRNQYGYIDANPYYHH